MAALTRPLTGTGGGEPPVPPIPVAPDNTSPPTIAGNSALGSVLTTSNGSWSGYPYPTFTYQWTRNGSNIGGATGSQYTTQVADVGATIRSVVTATNASGSDTATSSNNIVVDGVAPANTVVPAVTGGPNVGTVLTTTNGTWTGTPTPTYARQWKRDGVNISGATATTYTLVAADAGHAITCTVTATNSAGSAQATSNAVTAVGSAPANTVLPNITGTAEVGQVLTVSNGTWTGVPAPTYTRQWKRNGTNISGATGTTYTLQGADAGTTITATVTATNAMGNASATSAGRSIPAAPSVPVNTVAPVASGSTAIGSTLSVTNGTWTNSPVSYTYQWRRGGTNISGATSSTYVSQAADYNQAVTCQVTATNGAGSGQAVSNGITPVSVPTNTALPAVSGGTTIGDTLSATTGSWNYTPTSFSYQWQKDGVDISGQTASTLDTTGMDAGDYRVGVVAVNATGNSAVAYSTAVTMSAGGGGTALFGYDTVPDGESHFPTESGRILASRFSKGEGAVTRIFARFDNGYGAVNAKVICFADGADPGTMLWATPAHVAADGVVEFALPVAGLSASTAAGSYWLGVVCDSYETYSSTQGDVDGQAIKRAEGYNFASPGAWGATADTYMDSVACVWCEYEGSGGGGLAPSNVTQPALSGDAVEGSTLTTTNGTWNNTPTSYTYAWLSNGVSIGGATSSTYVTTTGDVGSVITSRVTAINAAGSASAVSSNSVGVTAANPGPPVNTVAPAVVGGTTLGNTLTCSTGTWTNTPTSYSYQWQFDDVNISGATSATLNTTGRAEGDYKCVVTATNVEGSNSADSNVITMHESSGIAATFGFDGTSTSSWPSGYGAFLATQFTKNNGEISSASCRLESVSAGANVRLVVYSNNGSNRPGAVLWATTTKTAVNGVNVFTLPGDVSSTDAGGTYWIAVVVDGTGDARISTDYYYDGQWNSGYFHGSISAPPNSPTFEGEYVTTRVCAWCDYTDEGQGAEAPYSITVPVLAGSAMVGATLSASTGTWGGFPPPTYTYQWERDDVNISGETSSTYTSDEGDIGHVITCTVTATNSSGSLSATSLGRTIIDAAELGLNIDFSHVTQSGSRWTNFIAFVDAAVGGSPGYGFSAKDAAYAYKMTNNSTYRTLAINTVEAQVSAAEAAIAGNTNPEVAGDSYLHVGDMISDLALVYEWCNGYLSNGQKTRWAAYADQVMYNVWHPSTATWGGRPASWSGWSTSDPGNNYYYSFIAATAYWSLASDNIELLEWLDENKLNPLRSYMGALIGGGSQEGTGYGASHGDLFVTYKTWEDSDQSALAFVNDHMRDTGKWWLHSLMPTRDKYLPVGDLARESYPNIYDYHRKLMLYIYEMMRLRNDPGDTQQLSDMSWWLNNISIQNVSGFNRKYNLFDPGNNTSTPPSTKNYFGSGTGHVMGRNGWGTGDTFAFFLAGPYGQSHAAQQQGCFLLYNGNFLTASGNIWSHTGINQGVNCNNVLCFRTSANAIIPQSAGTATNSVTLNNDGGFVATANLKPIISNATVTSWNRTATFNATAHQLRVQDSYATTSGTTATFQFVVPSLPTVSGNTITCGDLRAVVSTPASPTINVVNMTSVDSDFQSGYRVDVSGASGSFDVTFYVISKQ